VPCKPPVLPASWEQSGWDGQQIKFYALAPLCVLSSAFRCASSLETDLGLSKNVKGKGNPTEHYCRAGIGASLGAGIKLRAVRIEWATEQIAGTGNLFVSFGEVHLGEAAC